ncbi:hypothetical protein [Burkholderia vietnamiensis]|uniref:hypothetical protein n=1 Tax=Burkholderia vietnamiensis TaxID=60552 RepID=UPI00158AB67B|nr:hypothetical protein [Burkholderia vietnamiensis]
MTRNERIKELHLERRNLAAALTWPESTPFLLNPDPVMRSRLKHLALAVGAAAAVFLMSGPSGPIGGWLQSTEFNHMRPAMETAMQSGNRAAGTWLALHYRKDYPGLLEQEADAGEPTAMFLVGRLMSRVEHPERAIIKIDPSMSASQVKAKGFELMRRAAAAGNQDALKYLIQNGGL